MRKITFISVLILTLLGVIIFACKKQTPFTNLQTSKKNETNQMAMSSARSANTQEMLEGDIAPNSTINLLKGGLSDDIKLSIENKGQASLKFCKANSETMKCTGEITVLPGETKNYTLKDLGGSSTGQHVNVTNPDMEDPGHYVVIIERPNPIVNEYEYFGQLHNNALDEVAYGSLFSSYVETGKDVGTFENSSFFPEAFKIISKFISTELKTEIDATAALEERKNDIKILIKDPDEGFRRLITSSLYLNEKQKELFAIMKKEIDISYSNSDVLWMKLKAFESSVIVRNDLTKAEKAPILIGSSVARYSGKYWTNVFKTREHPYHAYLTKVGENNGGAEFGSGAPCIGNDDRGLPGYSLTCGDCKCDCYAGEDDWQSPFWCRRDCFPSSPNCGDGWCDGKAESECNCWTDCHTPGGGGGSTAGYNCSGGGQCQYVSSGAQYSTEADCKDACKDAYCKEVLRDCMNLTLRETIIVDSVAAGFFAIVCAALGFELHCLGVGLVLTAVISLVTLLFFTIHCLTEYLVCLSL